MVSAFLSTEQYPEAIFRKHEVDLWRHRKSKKINV